MSEKYSPEEKAKIAESRTKSDAHLIERGAHYRPDEDREPVLTPPARQIKTLKNEDSSTREAKERKDRTEVLRTFQTPDQTEELDFKAFLGKMLFGSFYWSTYDRDESFQKMVYNTSESFSGIKGRIFEEIKVAEKTGEKAVLAERNIKPISLNEWRYLLTQLSREQLFGNTYYRVQFEDGAIHTIEVNLHLGDGPHGASFKIHKLSPQNTIRGPQLEDIYPRFIAPAE